jgi:uncharacterized protein YdeI (YjbR/CyaY-like superfamily)
MDEPRYFESPAELRQWLKANHDRAMALWVGLHKTSTGKAALTWPLLVDEVLSFGWIDGARYSIDAERWAIRITPRKPRSPWSEKNLKRVPELIAEGRMTPAGLAAYEARSEKTPYSYERKTPAELTPAEQKRLDADKKAAEWFAAQAPSYRRTAFHWIANAKQPATRERRLVQLIDHNRRGVKLPQFDSARYKSKP